MLKHCIHQSYEKFAKHTEVYKHYSYLIQRNTILAVGSNRRVNHACMYPRQTFHSEYVAWNRGHRRIDGRKSWYMVNVRIGNDLSVRMSKPCAICEGFLKSVGCSEVIYTVGPKEDACLKL